MIRCEAAICGNLEEALSREWLDTNGLGGFACSTITGANTRRYHALLTAATHPPVGRFVLLSKLEETLVAGGQRFDLATNEYAGAVHPRGFECLAGFRLDPFPVFTFACAGVRLEKTVFMRHGQNTTVVLYRLLQAPAGQAVELEVRPLIAFRDYHCTTHENAALNPAVDTQASMASVAPYPGLPRLYLAHNAVAVTPHGYWYRNFFYRIEHERGLDAVEDLFNPMTLRFTLAADRHAVVIASTAPQRVEDAAAYRAAEIARRECIEEVAAGDEFSRTLSLAADQFLVGRESGATVIAGYPWFTDWGRDTMISLPGLTLRTGNAVAAKDILRTFAAHVDQGMLPNCFRDDRETPEFNSVDAALWYVESARAYAAATRDDEFVRNVLYPVLASILDWYMKGTRYGIRMDDNGLLNAGAPGLQLTWMDARVGGCPVTPRSGKAVEVQALWYNALKILEDFAGRFSDTPTQRRCNAAAPLVHASFNRRFWNDKAGCLYDVVDPEDAAIRPNQILAISLHYPVLAEERMRQVVEVVERELLTPVGLRSLSPGSPGYRGRYEGGQEQRDAAYHQGTVWPWLLGPFITAYLRVNGGSAEAKQRAAEMIAGLREHLGEAGLGQISEIFDGDAPHRPRGCFAQAWSVAEVLRAWREQGLGAAAAQQGAARLGAEAPRSG